MTYLLSGLFFLVGIIGIFMGYYTPPLNWFTPSYPIPFIAGVIFITTGGIIWAIADLRLSFDLQKKDHKDKD